MSFRTDQMAAPMAKVKKVFNVEKFNPQQENHQKTFYT